MTEDHIFPKSITIPGQKKITQVLKRLDPSNKHHSNTKIAQNGIKKRTLCSHCNNKILGTLLDPALSDLCKEVSLQLRNARFLHFQTLHIENAQMNKVARAVAGHMLALDDEPQAKHVLARKLRRFVLDEKAKFPAEYNFQMWLYPFKEQAIYKDLYHGVLGEMDSILGISAFKTYPLAFAFCNKIKSNNFTLLGVIELADKLNSDIEQKYRISIPTTSIVDQAWPYAPHPNGVILTSSNESLTTKPFMNIKKFPY
ncbi:hypothetical protein [Pseudomonas sp. 210_17 TE3656]